MQSLTDGKTLFTMDLLNSNNNNTNENKGVQAEMSEPKNTECGSYEEDFINTTPPDQSNLVIPNELIVVRRPNMVIEEDEIGLDLEDITTTTSGNIEEPKQNVHNSSDNSTEDEFVYTEPPKLSPVDQSLIFVRRPETTHSIAEIEDILKEEPPEPKIQDLEFTTPVNDDISRGDNDSDSDYDYDYFSICDADAGDDFTDELNEDEIDVVEDTTVTEEVTEETNSTIALEDTKEKEVEQSFNINSTNSEEQVNLNLDDDITYESEDSKYNENKYRSDNIIRDYEEDNKYSYPLLYLSGESIEMYRVQALSGMLDKRSFIEGDELYYNVYVEIKGSVVHLGKLLSKLLRTILNNQTFSTFNKKIYLNPNTFYEGDMLYALSEIDISLLD